MSHDNTEPHTYSLANTLQGLECRPEGRVTELEGGRGGAAATCKCCVGAESRLSHGSKCKECAPVGVYQHQQPRRTMV